MASSYSSLRLSKMEICYWKYILCLSIYTDSVSRSSSWPHKPSMPSCCPWTPASPVAGTWTNEPPRPQHHFSCWLRPSHTHTHAYTGVLGLTADSSVLSPLETQALSHPELTLRHPHTLLIPGHFTFLLACSADLH